MPASFRWPFRRKNNSADTESQSSASDTTVKFGAAPPSATENQFDETPPFGIKVLVERTGEQCNCVDIIAVHGLNGHREKTWRTSATGVNWLSDQQCLQKDIPNARVMSFGYNSRTYFSRSDSDIQDFASELLAALQAHRRTRLEQQRPIIFVCHSLGGIVFKQAVVKAHEHNSFYANILSSIRGAVFFGTPHRGSDLASWDQIGTVLHKAGNLGYVTNTKISRDLKVNAEFLKRVSESFVCRVGDMQFRSFYETGFMPGLTCRVVERESATLGITNELAIASPSHHANICKFASPADTRYKTAVFAINELAKVSEEEDDRPFTLQEQGCMRELNSDYELHLGQVDDPIPGTCEWVLSHRKWHQWSKCEESALLWISADAGCGKSVLAKFLVNHLRDQEPLPAAGGVCYFFFKEGLDGQDNAAAAASALLHQMCSSHRWLIKHAMPKYTSMPKRAFNRLSSLWPILIQILESMNQDVIWILDGLDECDKSSLDDLLRVMRAYMDSKRGITSQHRLMIILLSRPHNSIQQKLEVGGNDDKDDTRRDLIHHNKMRLRAEEETIAVARDISLFVQHKIAELGQQELLSDDLLSRLQHKLIHGADFTFLWISLVIQLVEDAGIDGISAVDLESILGTTRLDDVYERLLSGTTQPLKTKKVLMIVLAAVRPLTLKEMCAAVEVLQDHGSDMSASGIIDYEAAGIGNPKHTEYTQKSKATEIFRGFSQHKLSYNEDVNNPIRNGMRNNSARSTNKIDDTEAYDLLGDPNREQTAVSSLESLEKLLHTPFSNHLRRICGHFVRIRGRRIYLVHQTARQFLLQGGLKHYRLDVPLAVDTLLPEMPAEMPTEPRRRVKLKPNAHGQWRHSIQLGDADQYLLQVCASYISLFIFDKPGSDIKWTGKLVTEYLRECREDRARVFFRYATRHWIDHYRPLRQSLDFSFDYLLNPKSPLFKLWIIVHRGWNVEKEYSGAGLDSVRIPDKDGKRVGFDEEFGSERSKKIEEQASLQDVLDHFWLDFGVETEHYDQVWLAGPRYWKSYAEQAEEEEIDSADEADTGYGSNSDGKNFANVAKRIPDRIQYFRKQHREEYLKNWEELKGGGNPSSTFSSGTLTSAMIGGFGLSRG